MNEQRREVVVVSDLDGTLLDHYTYDAAPALPAIARLRDLGIPLVLNSSKTAAEIRQIRRELHNSDPYIAENGAVLFLPDNSADDGMAITQFGMSRHHILHVLAQIAVLREFAYLAFSTMSVDQLIACTGLDRARADLSMSRQYTEPLLWRDSDEQLDAFARMLSAHGLRAVRGGRFVFVSALVDKATPLDDLLGYYRTGSAAAPGSEPLLIALGDGNNDLPMLERADHAVVVRSPVRAEPPRPARESVTLTGQTGPRGWNEAVNTLLDNLGY